VSHSVEHTGVHKLPLPNGTQNCPVGQSQEVVQGVPPPAPPVQYAPPEASWMQMQRVVSKPQDSSGKKGSQGVAFGGIQESTQVPLLQFPLQHSLPPAQDPPLDVQPAAHLLLSHLPLQHCLSFLHFFPSGLHRSSAAASPTPRDASVPPTRAAPINLSALRREMLPLATSLASASKACPLASSLTETLLSPRGGGLIRPAVLNNVVKYERLQDPAQLPRTP
jgi:hypothetical protein